MKQAILSWGKRIVGGAAVAGLSVMGSGCTSMNGQVLAPRQMKNGMVPPPYQTQTISQRHKGSVVSPFSNSRVNTVPELLIQPPNMTGITPPMYVAPTRPKRTKIKLPTVPKVTMTYRVKKGDYLSKIAQMHGVSTRELASFNKMNTKDVLMVGKVLNLPPGSRSPKSIRSVPKANAKWHTVAGGEILGRIANKHDVSIAELVKWNKLANGGSTIYKGQKPAVNPAAAGMVKGSQRVSRSTTIKRKLPASGIHKVAKNESWWSIAHKYQALDSAKLRDINAPKRTLHPGDIIYLTYAAVGKKVGKVEKTYTTKTAALPANSLYTVRSGDTLSGIAKKFRVRLRKIRDDNSLKTDLLMPGMTLIIKTEDASAGKPKIKTDRSTVATRPSGNSTIIKTQKVSRASAKRTMLPHFIDQTSDTLEEIADMYGSKVAWIKEANPKVTDNKSLRKMKEIQVPVEDINLGSR